MGAQRFRTKKNPSQTSSSGYFWKERRKGQDARKHNRDFGGLIVFICLDTVVVICDIFMINTKSLVVFGIPYEV